jgi:outer membrane receptor protein involved in Fe transport
MKKSLLSILGCLLCLTLFGQNGQQNISVKGIVIDSVSKQPLSYVTIALLDINTHQPVKSILTKEDGGFQLISPAGKIYQLVITFIGYKNKIITLRQTDLIVNVGNVVLSPSNKQLSAVSITAQKPLMKQEVDRLSYDVQADPDSKIMNALDMIRKVPLLSVDATDNIKLRGSGSYKILINGKESALMANNPSDILKSMPASNIVKIEVITTPPAKYDAEGLAGIINIITQKNAAQGYNGSINTTYNTVNGYRANLNATIKEGKIGYSGFVGTGNRSSLGTDFVNISSFYNPVPSSLLQQGTTFNGGRNTINNNELSYELDSLNLFSGTFNYFKNDGTQGNNQFTTERDRNDIITQAYHNVNTGTSTNTGTDIGLNYQLGFKANKGELLTASYRYNNSNGNQFNNVVVDNTTNYHSPNYRQYNSSGLKESTTQLDYIEPLKVIITEAGGKMILRNNYSNFQTDTLNAAGNKYNTNTGQTDDFNYHQNVYSLYNSYLLKFAKCVFKGGLRGERTTINADFSSGGSTVEQKYNNLVPSLSAQRTLTTTSSLTFGFTQRIQRPRIGQLNPFVNLSNPQYINVGNPDLRPAINNNFELNYGNFAKGSFNISTHYSFSNNTIQYITTVDTQDVTTTTYANIGQNKTLGIDLNTNYPITKKWNVDINAELLQVWLKGAYNGKLYTNSGQQGHIFTYTDYKFDKGIRASIYVGFDSRYVLLEGRDNWYFSNSYSLSKELLKSKSGVYLIVANPFSEFNKLDFFTKTPDFQNYNYNLNHYRIFGTGFYYKFGKLNSTIKKNQRGINNDDASSGGKS